MAAAAVAAKTVPEFSPEAEALKLDYSYLVNSIDTDSLLPIALSKQLLTIRQRDECAGESTDYKKAEKFLGYLQRAINGDSDKFYTLVQILDETSQSKIASRLHG